MPASGSSCLLESCSICGHHRAACRWLIVTLAEKLRIDHRSKNTCSFCLAEKRRVIPELFLERRPFGQAGRDYDREPLLSPESETAPAASRQDQFLNSSKSVQEMDGVPSRDAPVHNHPQGQYFLLSRREITVGQGKLGSERRGRSGSDSVRNDHGPTRRESTAGRL
ncbi:hypothetical protein B0T21DRAFT_332556, partial [Apiosordaria backusii]